jgi:hypothetical protein
VKDSYGRPRRREQGLLLEDLDDELVVCDTSADSAHVLNAVAAAVWRACDGQRDLQALQVACGRDESTVIAALDGLRACGLLVESETDAKLSRRGVLTKGAAIGAGIGLGAPLIRSIALPSPAAAASGGPGSTPAPTTTLGPLTTAGPMTTSTTLPPNTTRGPILTTTAAP